MDKNEVAEESLQSPVNQESTQDESDHCRLQTESGWCGLPYIPLGRIYGLLNYDDLFAVSLVCREWRHCLLTTSQLWEEVRLDLRTPHDARMTFFLRNCVVYCKDLRVHWPVTESKNIQKLTKADHQIRDTLIKFFNAMILCQNLRKLVLWLENRGAFKVDFVEQVKGDLQQILENNPRLEYLSFGCHPFIKPEHILDVIHENSRSTLRELHIASSQCQVMTERTLQALKGCQHGDQLSAIEAEVASSFTNLVVLSVDWRNVTSSLLRGLNQRGPGASCLRKLNLFVQKHRCTPKTHPSPQDWALFADQNKDVVVHMIMVRDFPCVCDGVEHIRPGVYMLKILECPVVDSADLSRFLLWHKDTIVSLVQVAAWSTIALENSNKLGHHLMDCLNVKSATFLGYSTPIYLLRYLAPFFGLRDLVVSRAHVVDTTQESDCHTTVSDMEYEDFAKDMTRILRHPWKALPEVPLKGNYFAEGRDDVLYLTGETGPLSQ